MGFPILLHSISEVVPKPKSLNFPQFAITITGALMLAMISCERQNAARTSPPDLTTQHSLPEKISFNEHIQPILSEHCYHCHGPDSGTREPKKSPLRLDRVDDAFALRDDGSPVILKGNPAESSLIKRIHSTDPDEIMPPPKSHKVLGEKEIALLEKWIEQGAEYEPHWSFGAIKNPPVPTAGKDWAKNPIDSFIAEKLEKSSLRPNPPENPARFYRRLHFDLTGLPPLPAAVADFQKAYEKNPQAATEAAADQLMATTASAEHFTRQWLDAARYADTHGIHIDNYRAIWPYRDWVIRAFKSNMPWDRFTTEQIAGDMLPDATLDQKVATGFSRCLATTGEGGAIPEEYDAIYAKDRVETVSAIWLGLTTGCAACHDHKFDPISTKEFYSLAAFFRNTPMTALDGNFADHPPAIFVPLVEDRAEWAKITQSIDDACVRLAARATAARPEFEKWLTTAKISSLAPVVDSSLALHLPLTAKDGPIHAYVDGKSREFTAEFHCIPAPIGHAPLIHEKPIDLKDLGKFARKDRVTYGGFVRVKGAPTGSVVSRMESGNNFRGWDLYLENGRPAAHLVDQFPVTYNKCLAPDPLTPGVWHHVMVTFDGTAPNYDSLAIYVDGKRVKKESDPSSLLSNIENGAPLTLGSRRGGKDQLDGLVALQDFRIYNRLLKSDEIAAIARTRFLPNLATTPKGKFNTEQNDAVFQYYVSNMDAASRQIQQEIEEIKKLQKPITQRGSISLIMEEKKDEPYAHVLTRGVYSDKGEKVFPTTPAALPPMSADAPKNRLGLAKWLTDPASPLPAR
ncbi:MAG: DUF1549 domain-containing protein, partial [Gloeobacteraceae cyanobacterium ES-bin-144]|nr:DUF1549 domain-containing protein [Verrucomicrobiales bacterium]